MLVGSRIVHVVFTERLEFGDDAGNALLFEALTIDQVTTGSHRKLKHPVRQPSTESPPEPMIAVRRCVTSMRRCSRASWAALLCRECSCSCMPLLFCGACHLSQPCQLHPGEVTGTEML